MNRRFFLAVFAALALVSFMIGPIGATGKDDFNRHASFVDVSTTRLNAWTVGINTRSLDKVMDSMTSDGSTTFLGSDPGTMLTTISAVRVVAITHVLESSDLNSVEVTANIIGLTGRSAFSTQKFTLLRQGNGDYLIDVISAGGADVPHDKTITELAMTVNDTFVSTSGSVESADFIRLQVFNKTQTDETIALYPAGVAITDPAEMAGRLTVETGQISEIILADLLPGRYIIVSEGIALGTIFVK